MLKVALFNCNGLAGKADSILEFAQQQNIDLFFILETWLIDSSSSIFNNTFINITKPRIGNNAGGRIGRNGVLGFCTNPHILPHLRIIYEDPERYFFFLSYTEYIIGVGYFPPSLNNNHITTFFDQAEILSQQFTEQVILLGDFNARLGALTNDHFLDSKRAPHFMDSILHYPINIHLAKNGRYTTYAGGGSGVTDLVISNDVNIHDLTIHENQPLGGSDHRPVTFGLGMAAPPEKEFARWNVRRLLDEETKTNYRNYLHLTAPQTSQMMQDMAEVLEEAPQDAVDSVWATVRDWYDKAALETVGVLQYKTKTHKGLMDTHLRRLQQTIAERATTLQQAVAQKRPLHLRCQLSAHLNDANREYRREVQKRRQKLWCEFVDNLGTPQSRGSFLKMAKNLRARRARKQCKLDPLKMREHEEYFRRTTFGAEATGDDSLYSGNNAIPDDLPYEAMFWTAESLMPILKKLPMGKAAGDDRLMGEFISHGGEISAIILSELFNIISKFGTVPTQWRTALVVPIYKEKGSDQEIKNYRPISLTCVIRRIYEKRLMLELGPQLRQLSDFQGGFRPKRSTLDQIFYLEEVMEEHINCLNIFLDIQTAYDTVDRRILWAKLYHHHQVRWSTLKMIQALFDHNSCVLLIGGQRSESINTLRGLLQGSSLSPILFNFYIDSLLRLLNANGLPKISTSGLKSNALAFADDLNLHGLTVPKLQQLLTVCEQWSIQHGITFAPTKCLVLGNVEPGALRLYNLPLPVVESATYLGMVFNRKGVDWEVSFNKRLNKARSTIIQFSQLGFNGTGWAFPAAITVYKSFMRSQLEYGMGLRILPTPLLEKVQKVQNLALRTLAGTHRTVSRNALHRLFLVEPMKIRNQQLNITFVSKLHNSTDATIPAVRMWRNKITTRHKTSLAVMATRNPLWPAAFKMSHLTTRLRRAECSPPKAFTKKELHNQQLEAIKALDRGKTNVAGCVPVLDTRIHLHCLLPGNTIDRKQRSTAVHWLLGCTARHQGCLNCHQHTTLSRNHALECSGALPLILAEYGHLLRPDSPVNALSQLFNTFANNLPPPDFYKHVEKTTAMIHTHCLGFLNALPAFEARQADLPNRAGMG